MTVSANVLALAVAVAGAAFAAPAVAAEREPACPEMPTTNDRAKTREGGGSFTIAGTGVNATRARTSSVQDVMMRYGSFDDWSKAAVMAFSCEANRQVYRGNPARQRDEFEKLRRRLLGIPEPAIPGINLDPYHPSLRPAPTNEPLRGSRASGWTFEQLWKPSAPPKLPLAAIFAGVEHGSATIDCRLSRTLGLDDCRVVSESSAGLNLGAVAIAYLESLQLNDEPARAEWPTRRISRVVRMSGR